jgi:hypothetical protein
MKITPDARAALTTLRSAGALSRHPSPAAHAWGTGAIPGQRNDWRKIRLVATAGLGKNVCQCHGLRLREFHEPEIRRECHGH